jgi:outer membrane protein TolC
MTSHRQLAGFAILSLFASTSSGARAAEPLEETAGIVFVCTAGPRAALAHAERLRGRAEVEAAGVLPNPSLVVTHQRALSGATDTETVVGLSVQIGIGGRRFILKDAARARRDHAQLDAGTTLFESALAFRQAYVAAVADQARVRVAVEQQAAFGKLSDIIRGLAKGGEAAGYDLLRQEIQAKLHRRSLESLRAKAARSRALLTAWTGHEVTLPAVPLLALAGGSRARARQVPSSQHPRVESLEAAARASALEARAARRRWVPDLELFAGYRATGLVTETGHGVSLGVTMPLTFFDHGQGEAVRAEAEEAYLKAAASMVRRQQRAELKASLAELELLEASVVDAEQLVEGATRVQARAEQLYTAGEGSITELLEAFRSAEEAQFALIGLGEEIAMARLSLMRSLGSLLDPTLDQHCGGKSRGAR